MDYEAFHCRIDIIRNVPDTLRNRDAFVSTFEKFFTRTPTSFISVGSASKSSIIIDHIDPVHCSFNFQQDSLFIKTMAETTVVHNDKEIILKKDDLFTLPFNPNELIDFYTLLEWKIIIHPYVEISGIVTLEEAVEKESVENYLNAKYDDVKKLEENNRYLIYRIGSDRVAKILHPYHNKNKLNVDHFFQAAKQISDIQNELLCEVKAAYSDLPHVVLDFFAGDTLANYLAKKGRTGYREAFLVTKKIAEFLKVTRERNYVCKTLSLNNILCAGSKKIKFTGFNTEGLSIAEDSLDIFYMSPEFIRDEEVSFPCDIFSLGVITYRLISGKFPFSDVQEYKNYIAQGKSLSKADLERSSSYITPQIASFLELMLAFDPGRRPTPSGVLDWLKDIYDIKLWHYVLNMHEENVFFGLQVISSVKPIRGEICVIQNNKTSIIGRSADINIPGDFRISRQHTKITLDNGVCILEDLGSSNGTKIDGEKISERKIENGTSFLIGETVLCFWDFQKLRDQRL
ncbi:protein kinase domain-containing protein [Candidatus Uabimicrobium amorphum]|uniref:Serine/threonine-protein kinases PknA n=1 Tax=Uabimicrobium amorphum TaxID=2596890 RepID=A0A5S9F3N5_UABAM|nr:FHA domain-containing protein [Candidatus Uabimicrobium amorphum]BBM84333.1 serine/threonine-protein kinases PknA [Candidatus Uabimicrobium amorphum]